MSTYSLIQNGELGSSVRNKINSLFQNINEGEFVQIISGTASIQADLVVTGTIIAPNPFLSTMAGM